MTRKIIEITINPTGEIEIEAVGFRGADCEQATAFLEEVLGQVTHKRQKPEYHRRVCRREVQRFGT